MRIWKFYLNTEKLYDEKRCVRVLEEKYPLYAFTTDKEFVKNFREERNMDLFIESKSKITKEDAKKFTMNHREKLLIEDDLCTKADNSQGYKYVRLTLTQSEHDDIESVVEVDPFEMIFQNIYGYGAKPIIPDPYIFTDEYRKLLQTIGYTTLFCSYGSVSGNPYYDSRYDRMIDEGLDDPDSVEITSIDELVICIRLFGHLFKDK